MSLLISRSIVCARVFRSSFAFRKRNVLIKSFLSVFSVSAVPTNVLLPIAGWSLVKEHRESRGAKLGYCRIRCQALLAGAPLVEKTVTFVGFRLYSRSSPRLLSATQSLLLQITMKLQELITTPVLNRTQWVCSGNKLSVLYIPQAACSHEYYLRFLD